MSRLTRDGTAEPVSRDQILRHARGQGNIIFRVQLTTSRIGNLTRLIHTLLYVMTTHTYIPFLQTSRTSAVSYPPCAPQIPHTRSTSCVKSPRCSHFPSREACPDRKSGGRRDCAFANRCSESRIRGGLDAACRSGTRAGST